MKKSKLFIVNANVITMDENRPRANYIEIDGDEIARISDKRYTLKGDKSSVIDCRGKTVLPGFIDAHQHFIGLAKSLITPNIGKKYAKSISDIQNIIKKIADNTPPGEWIRAQGYQVYDLIEKRTPNKWDLDKATTSHPVVLTHATGYINVLNSMGLAKINITGTTPAPEGGLIERDLASGEPNGILFGMRHHLAKLIPRINKLELENAIKPASELLVSLGITSIHDASELNNLSEWNTLVHYRDSGRLIPRLNMILGRNAFSQDQYKKVKGEDNRLRCQGVKIILHEASGKLYPTKETLEKLVLEIQKEGSQAVIHAIEEHVIIIAADAIEKAVRAYPRADHRHRIEHCFVCGPDLARRLAKLGIVTVIEPSFIYYNGERYLKTVEKDKMKHIHPLKTLFDAGLVVAAGSDAPVVPPYPLSGICAAVTRRTEKGNSLRPGEKIGVTEAIKMYTVNAAYSVFEEKLKGTITPGKLADLIILSEDPTKVKPEEIKDIKIEMVIIGGEIVYRENGFNG